MHRTLEPDAPGSCGDLRRELSARNVHRARSFRHETTFGELPSVVYEAGDDTHGNFYPASYRAILKQPVWRERLSKAYTASDRIARAQDRKRYELDCANSSDALLMNIFCSPTVRRSARLRNLLGVCVANPQFGVRAHIPLKRGLNDRTEVDLVLQDESDCLLVEAKLTETSFQSARAALLERYECFEEVFERDRLPHNSKGFQSYQLIRCVLAADHLQARFAALVDARRPDLMEATFRIFAAVRASELRSRLHLFTWQEIAACAPRPLQRFLAEKYGVVAPPRSERNPLNA